jgi:hypothetical protein
MRDKRSEPACMTRRLESVQTLTSARAMLSSPDELLELGLLMHDVLAAMRLQAGRKLVVTRLDAQDRLAAVCGDRERFTCVLKSVVACVIELTAVGGQLDVCTRVGPKRVKVEIESLRASDGAPLARSIWPECKASPKLTFVLHAASALLQPYRGWISADCFESFGTTIAISLPLAGARSPSAC